MMINVLKKPGMHEYNCGCGCTFTFENEDVKYEYISDNDGTEYFTINCPYCKRVLGVAFVLSNDDLFEIRKMWRKEGDAV